MRSKTLGRAVNLSALLPASPNVTALSGSLAFKENNKAQVLRDHNSDTLFNRLVLLHIIDS